MLCKTAEPFYQYFFPFMFVLFQVDTEMDAPLPLERPLVEVSLPTAITISFFAPRPTLRKMKIQRFVAQVSQHNRSLCKKSGRVA